MTGAAAFLCFCVALRHTISMMVNGCGYLFRTSLAFPVAAIVAASALILTPSAPFLVPLWVAGAETLVIAVLLIEARRVLRGGHAR